MKNLREETLKAYDLTGKVAVITGGASGIGLGAVELLSSMGAKVAVLDIQSEKAIEEVERINSEGGDAKFYYCDVRSGQNCKSVAEEIKRDFGTVNVLFNNAGVAIRKNCVDLDENEWDLALDVTLKGVFMLSKYIIPMMQENGGGSVINTGSGWSLKGGNEAVSYCAAKGGVLNLTRAMAIDHGKDNIRVNCICPGDIDTALLRSECAQLGEDEEEFMKDAANRPIARVGTTQDVANAVLFFASDLSTWVTGTHLVVDGGGIA